jgi:hypothetical protein
MKNALVEYQHIDSLPPYSKLNKMFTDILSFYFLNPLM